MTVIQKCYDSVNFVRGMGDSGYRVKTVEHTCPNCSFDRMICRHDVNPELPDELRFWCLNPNCKYFVRDELSYACNGSYPQSKAMEPLVFE